MTIAVVIGRNARHPAMMPRRSPPKATVPQDHIVLLARHLFACASEVADYAIDIRDRIEDVELLKRVIDYEAARDAFRAANEP